MAWSGYVAGGLPVGHQLVADDRFVSSARITHLPSLNSHPGAVSVFYHIVWSYWATHDRLTSASRGDGRGGPWPLPKVGLLVAGQLSDGGWRRWRYVTTRSEYADYRVLDRHIL